MSFTPFAPAPIEGRHVATRRINLIANYKPKSVAPAAYFAAEHSPSACGMAFRVNNARLLYDEAMARGRAGRNAHRADVELRLPTIRGIGGTIIYLINHYASLDKTRRVVDLQH